MSNITEQTIVIAREQEENFRKSYEHHKDEYRLDNLKEAYSNEQIIIFIYDCNGDAPWLYDTSVPFLFLEIAYSGKELDTIKGDYSYSRFHLRYHLKKLFPSEVDVICKNIAYTMNKIYD